MPRCVVRRLVALTAASLAFSVGSPVKAETPAPVVDGAGSSATPAALPLIEFAPPRVERPALDAQLRDLLDRWRTAADELGDGWIDEFLCCDWRVERNVVNGACRLIDPQGREVCRGEFDACRAKLAALQAEGQAPAVSGRVVITLHGLFRSRDNCQPIAEYLRDEGGYTVLSFGYPSTKVDVAACAAALGRVVAGLDERCEEINFVGHSLGNIVLRHYLADAAAAADGAVDPRIRRIVMLGPPNQGAALARLFGETRAMQAVGGASAIELGARWDDLVLRLAVPPVEFGIIAGGVPRGNPLLPGDDDLVVRVAETHLPGAHDFVVLPVVHMGMMRRQDVQVRTLRFLQHGYFDTADQRRPLPREAPAP